MSVLAWMSATINPFIYAFKNRQYQQAFKKLLCCDTKYPGRSGNRTTTSQASGQSRTSQSKTFITEMIHYKDNKVSPGNGESCIVSPPSLSSESSRV